MGRELKGFTKRMGHIVSVMLAFTVRASTLYTRGSIQSIQR